MNNRDQRRKYWKRFHKKNKLGTWEEFNVTFMELDANGYIFEAAQEKTPCPDALYAYCVSGIPHYAAAVHHRSGIRHVSLPGNRHEV